MCKYKIYSIFFSLYLKAVIVNECITWSGRVFHWQLTGTVYKRIIAATSSCMGNRQKKARQLLMWNGTEDLNLMMFAGKGGQIVDKKHSVASGRHFGWLCWWSQVVEDMQQTSSYIRTSGQTFGLIPVPLGLWLVADPTQRNSNWDEA